jgi:hypothetical protein
MTFCGGINEDGERNSKKKLNIFVDYIYKKCTVGSSGTSVLYTGCMVPMWGVASRLFYI